MTTGVPALLPALLLGLAAPALLAPAAAAAQTADAGDPAAVSFIERLTSDAFAVLRDKSMTRDASRARFRTMLRENVALDALGQRLIRRHRAEATPAQLEAYGRAFPEFVLSAYADRLYDYADAEVRVQRSIARGPFTDVVTRVQRPGQQPIEAIWQVRKTAQGRYLVNNLTVGGINLAITQEADFSRQISQNGFDALITFLQSANARAAPAR
jgi:phospholipid transport system substrate-binding protein